MKTIKETTGFAIDFDTIADLIASDEEAESEILTPLVKLFIVNTPKRIETMRHAFEERNFEKVSREAHTLRSNCGNLGLLSMVSICRKLEETGGRQTTTSALSVISSIREIELEFLEARKILLGLLPPDLSCNPEPSP